MLDGLLLQLLNQNVMQISEEGFFLNNGLQNCMSVGKAKRYDQLLKMTKAVLKVFFHFSPLQIWNSWWAFCRLSLEKNLDLWTGLKASSISSKGYLFLMVISFRA